MDSSRCVHDAGIAKFLTLLATMFSKFEGSDVALNPRRINSIAMTLARIATTSSRRRKFFQRFMSVSIACSLRCAKAQF